MLKILSGLQMRQVDRNAVQELKIPELILMENAGRAVYEQVIEIIDSSEETYPSVLVICGKGNNGGDGFVAARHLVENAIQTTVLSLYRKDNLSDSSLINNAVLENFTEIIYLDEISHEQLSQIICASSVVVDAILGTGLNSKVKGDIRDVINAINEYSEGFVVAIDVPSGINADTGEVMGAAVVADYTATFHALKTGLILYPGAGHAGQVTIAPIGIPDILTAGEGFDTNLITDNYVSALMPIRLEDSHKGTFGKVFNIAGCVGMTGAAYMSAYASLKSGAGYSVLASAESAIPIVASMAPEIVCVPLEETLDKYISENALDKALDKSQNADVYLIGPGIGIAQSTVKFVAQFVQQLADRGEPLIIDADAINCLSMLPEFYLPVNSVVTPHAKELSRLMKVPVEDIAADRIKYAREAAAKFRTIVVLKGSKTIIAEPDGKTYINQTGNSGLATAGSGDILSGMIAGFAAQGLSLVDAAVAGVFLHGLAADIAAEELTEYSLTASELLNYIPEAIKEVMAD